MISRCNVSADNRWPKDAQAGDRHIAHRRFPPEASAVTILGR